MLTIKLPTGDAVLPRGRTVDQELQEMLWVDLCGVLIAVALYGLACLIPYLKG